jgi:hypothetical protein
MNPDTLSHTQELGKKHLGEYDLSLKHNTGLLDLMG